MRKATHSYPVKILKLKDFATGQNHLEQAARLIQLSMPDFYAVLPGSESERIALIISQIATEGTECHDPQVVVMDDEVVGIISAFSTSELAARQQSGVATLARAFDRDQRKPLLRAIAQITGTNEPIQDDNGSYIARVAIDPACQGMGTGRLVLQNVFETAASPVSLHVDRLNTGAIMFYRQLGFEFQSDGDWTKRVMIASRPPKCDAAE